MAIKLPKQDDLPPEQFHIHKNEALLYLYMLLNCYA